MFLLEALEPVCVNLILSVTNSLHGESLYLSQKLAAQCAAVTLMLLLPRQCEIACHVWVWTDNWSCCNTYTLSHNRQLIVMQLTHLHYFPCFWLYFFSCLRSMCKKQNRCSIDDFKFQIGQSCILNCDQTLVTCSATRPTACNPSTIGENAVKIQIVWFVSWSRMWP